jgi:very-short-patch-repair endonuclease
MSDFETRACAQCGKEFQLPTWETKRGKGKFCTRECFIKFNGESSLEEKVRKYLESKHIAFQQEVKFAKYRADFLLTGTKTIIECDGEFWHLRPQSKIRDKRKDKYLQGLGYKVFRLTGRQINERLEHSFALLRW